MSRYLGASSAILFVEDTRMLSRRVLAAFGCHGRVLASFRADFGLSDASLLPLYESFARAQLGVTHVMLGGLDLLHSRRLRVACHRGGERTGFSGREQARLGETLPYLARALQLQDRLEHEAKKADLSGTILDNLTCGTLLLSHDGELLHVNHVARSLTADAGLSIVGVPRGLEAQVPVENQRLQSLLQCVRAGGDGGVVRITRPTPLTPLVVWVRRLLQDGPAEVPSRHLALISMRELAYRPSWRAPMVKELFALTQAESEVVEELLEGLTARAIAKKRNVSLYTVQAQVRHILAKTGAGKMRDLVSMMAALFG